MPGIRHRTVLTLLPLVPLLAPLTVDAQSIVGTWATEGYGLVYDIGPDTMRAYQVTAVSCLLQGTARHAATPAGALAAFGGTWTDPRLIVLRGTSADNLRLQRPSAASFMNVHRIARLPAVCDTPTPDTPQSNFETFAATWAEQYPFFAEHKVDWRAVVAANRSNVTANTTPQELFTILADMIAAFEDAHTFIQAPAIQRTFSGGRRSPSTLEAGMQARGFALVSAHLNGPLREFCEGAVEFGMLAADVGYLRIRAFYGYARNDTYGGGLAALEAALDTVFAGASAWKGLVLDLRLNTGGADLYGLAVAARLTPTEYTAYAKQARSDPADPAQWTAPQPAIVRPSTRASYYGPVVELIGVQSVSAAETFTQALLDRPIQVTRVGENTQGVFSDVLGRRLPNGWAIGLPNERFVTRGRSYDVVGIAPDVPVVSFTPAALATGRDSAVATALRILLGAAQPAPTRVMPMPTSAVVAARVDSLITRALDDGPSAISVAITRGHDTLVMGAWGLADRAGRRPATAATSFRIGSITRQFTAAAVMRLVESGRVSLVDTIGLYVPTVPPGWGKPTIGQLLNHTGGIPDYDGMGFGWVGQLRDPFPPDSGLAAIARLRPNLDFPPGTGWSYSNVGYNMLGMLIELVYGRPYARVIDEELLRPLGITEMRYCEDAAGERGQALGYAGGAPRYTLAPYVPISHAFADGSLCGTAGDLATWNRALHDGRVLSPDSYASMTTPRDAALAANYGFGIMRGSLAGRPAVFHNGGMPGFRSENVWLPVDSLSITILCNSGTANLSELLEALGRLALGLPVTMPPPRVAVDSAILSRYVGTFDVALPARTLGLRIWVVDGRLVGQAEGPGQGEITFRATSDTTFTAIEDPSLRLTFLVTDGVASRMVFEQNGGIRDAVRRP